MYLAALAAIETGHPVKFMEDRIENMQAGDGHGPDRVYRVRVAADLDGTLRGLDFHLIEDLGAYCGRGPRQMTKPTAAVVGPYQVPAVRYSGLGVLTCKTNQVPFRGAGQSPHNFALERAIDRVARELGLDPVEIRLKNYIQPHQFPYEIPSGAVYDSGNFPGVCQLALETADLPRLRAEQAAARRAGRLVGIGLAGGLEPSGGAVDTGEGARIQIDENARLIVTIGFQSAGQAHESMVTQIACEELGVASADVMVERGHGLSGIVGGATTGSRMTLMLGSATKAACDKLRAKLVTLAAHRLGVPEADIVPDGRLFALRDAAGTVLDLTELARIAYGPRKNRPTDMEPGLVEQATFAGPRILHKNLRKGAKAFPSYAFDFHVVLAEVDPETFKITLRRFVVVHDCGTVLNPLVVDGFVYGGIGHGVGGALYEHFAYDESGQLTAASFMDYLMPTAAEIPDVELRSLETPSPLHPYGAKGSAEGSYMTAPAVIASAVEDAVAPLGIPVSEIPITPKLLYEGWVGR